MCVCKLFVVPRCAYSRSMASTSVLESATKQEAQGKTNDVGKALPRLLYTVQHLRYERWQSQLTLGFLLSSDSASP